MLVEWLKRRVRAKVGDYWSAQRGPVSATGEALRLRWWQSPAVLRDINRRVSGQMIDGVSAGLIALLKERYSDQLPLAKGVSVGCGSGVKEMDLLRAGLVDEFHLFELSEARVEKGRSVAKQRGLADRVHFHIEDAFEAGLPGGQFDLVHWNNALHHMFDMDQALAWSANMLRTGGVFYMDDFIGADRFQWDDKMLATATRARAALLPKYMVNPLARDRSIRAVVQKPNERRLASADPSEAVHSSEILPAVRKYFPNVDIQFTGGAIYNLTLADIIHNFDESDEKDRMILELLLMIDELCSDLGSNHYAVALATKS